LVKCMNNRTVCEAIRKLEKKEKEKEYLADTCVKEGYGQNCGGYLGPVSKKDNKAAGPSEKEHFLSYYGREEIAEKNPTYQYLRCPQLLLFIAEVAGVSKENLEKAYCILKAYEDKDEVKEKEKNGNYIWGQKEFTAFKVQLQISNVVKIIKAANNWDEVVKEVKQL